MNVRVTALVAWVVGKTELLLCFAILSSANSLALASGGWTMRLPVMRVGEPPSAYAEFCAANPGQCDMTGTPVIEYTAPLMDLLSRISREVNSEYRYVSDWDAYGLEETWNFPRKGVADCEDFALEKRRRLVERGLPRAALTLAIAYHKKRMTAHAVLLAETTRGTYLLDNLTDVVTIWNEAPYNYEARERVDGQWDRFDQSVWVFE